MILKRKRTINEINVIANPVVWDEAIYTDYFVIQKRTPRNDDGIIE